MLTREGCRLPVHARQGFRNPKAGGRSEYLPHVRKKPVRCKSVIQNACAWEQLYATGACNRPLEPGCAGSELDHRQRSFRIALASRSVGRAAQPAGEQRIIPRHPLPAQAAARQARGLDPAGRTCLVFQSNRAKCCGRKRETELREICRVGPILSNHAQDC